MLSVAELAYSYSSEKPVIANVTFAVVAGEIVSIVGPSGCGKTTLLKILAGLLRPMNGDVRFQGEIVRGVPDGLAMVFQEYSRSLLPWTTVTGNVELPLRYKKIDRTARARLVSDSLEAVGRPPLPNVQRGCRSPSRPKRGSMEERQASRPMAHDAHRLLRPDPRHPDRRDRHRRSAAGVEAAMDPRRGDRGEIARPHRDGDRLSAGARPSR